MMIFLKMDRKKTYLDFLEMKKEEEQIT